MSAFLTAFLFGLGVAAWVYAKLQRQSGGNTHSAATGAAVAGILGFIVIFTLGKMFLK